jgi:2-polyprenyl-3-methyl-5-hydroxy-6-metoxy-1,4-benzoquinol methylase
MKEVTEVTNCPITNDSDRFTYIDLGEMPLVNNLSDTREDSFNSPKYKLAVQYFNKSKLSCLTENVDPNLMFSQYSYKSGVVKAYADHCKEMFWFVDTYLNLKENDNLLDIGGNDGTLLHSFLEKKSYLNVLNVDASTNLTKLSRERGVPALNAFWGVETAKTLDKKFKLITSTNVFQHTPPIADFVEAISMSLDDKGIWCLEFPYWKTNMETLQFDQIYHEHVYFYLVEPLKQLFDKFGLEIIKAVKYPIHGGTLRLLISKKGDWSVCEGVEKIINEEQSINETYYKDWGEVIGEHISDCNIMLQACKNVNNNIVGFGAAAKGCIFLNSAKIDHTILDVVIDDTDLKQDKFIPGTGIQIKSREYLKENKVDYILILAHNFKDVIIESLRNDGYTGKFIILFPTIQIIHENRD